MSDNIVQISDSSFDSDVLQAEGPVLVDFGLNGAVLQMIALFWKN